MFWFDFNWQLTHVLNQAWWPINIALLIIAVVLGYLAYKKPVLAASGVLLLLPTYLFRSNIWWLPFTYLEVLIWVVFIGWLAHSIRTRVKIRGYRYPFRNLIILLLIAATIAMLLGPNRLAAAGLWKAYFVEPIMFFIVMINLLKEPKNRSTILWALGLSTLPICGLAIYQWFTGFGLVEGSWTNPATRRVTAMFTSPNAVGLYLGPIVAMYLGWLWQEPEALSSLNRALQKVYKIGIILLCTIAILFTKSAGALLGLAAAVVFLLFFGWSKRWTAFLVFVGLLTLLLLPATNVTVIEHLTFSDAAGQNRLTLWGMSKDFLQESYSNLALGGGMLGFAEYQDSVREPLTLEPLLYPHNIFLNFWVELGILGLVCFSWIFVKFFRLNYVQLKEHQADKWMRLGVMAAMVVILAHGMIDVPYFKNDLAVLFWTILALAI